MMRMLHYRTVLLAQTRIWSGIHPMETQMRAAQWREPTRRAKCLLCSLRGKQHWSMHESTSCSKWLCDNALVNVNKTFKQVNIHKAAGPDGLPGRVLKACADQLASVFIDIFQPFPDLESAKPTFQTDHHSPCAHSLFIIYRWPL